MQGEFAGEARDPGWSAAQEAQLAPRVREALAPLRVRVADLECRTRTCAITIESSDPDALAAAVSRLGEEGALYGVADQMIVAPVRQHDATQSVQVFARFDARP